jgi:hypothetical protein
MFRRKSVVDIDSYTSQIRPFSAQRGLIIQAPRQNPPPWKMTSPGQPSAAGDLGAWTRIFIFAHRAREFPDQTQHM